METTKKSILDQIRKFSSTGSLSDFISWLDISILEHSDTSLFLETLARSIVSLGYKFVEINKIAKDHPFIATIKAAEQYSLTPSEENWEGLFEASTNSYPFGPGEGCYDINSSKYTDCKPGTGCNSGAGSIDQIRLAIAGMSGESAMKHIADKLLPWLEDKQESITPSS